MNLQFRKFQTTFFNFISNRLKNLKFAPVLSCLYLFIILPSNPIILRYTHCTKKYPTYVCQVFFMTIIYFNFFPIFIAGIVLLPHFNLIISSRSKPNFSQKFSTASLYPKTTSILISSLLSEIYCSKPS